MIQFDLNQIILNKEGVEMASDYIFPKGKSELPVVIYTHGFNGFKDWGNFNMIAEEFAKAGIFFLKYNLSHNGTNIKNNSELVDLERYRNNNYSKEVSDLSAVIDNVQSARFPYSDIISRKNIYLLGHSRGVASTLLNAQRDDVKGAISWAGIGACTSPWARFSDAQMKEWKEKGTFYYSNKRTNQELPIDYQIYEDYLANKEAFELERISIELIKSLLFIHGTEDKAVPFSTAEQYVAGSIFAEELFSVESDHVFGRKHPWPFDYLPEATQKVVGRTIAFIKKYS